MQPVEDSTSSLPSPPAAVPEVVGWARSTVKALTGILLKIGYRLNRVLPKDGSEAMTAPLPLASYAAADLPAAADHPWAIVAVTDGAAGAQFRASNGTAWVNLG